VRAAGASGAWVTHDSERVRRPEDAVAAFAQGWSSSRRGACRWRRPRAFRRARAGARSCSSFPADGEYEVRRRQALETRFGVAHGPSRWSADENSSAPHERIRGRASRPSSRVSSKGPWRASRNRDSATPRELLLAWDRGCPAAPLAASSHACSFGSAAVARVDAPASPRRRRHLLLVEQAKV
jgi:hypothetical protein